MPDQGGGKAAAKPHVRRHLEKRKVDPADVPDAVIEALNGCSEDELDAMHRVGETMDRANVDMQLRVTMMH